MRKIEALVKTSITYTDIVEVEVLESATPAEIANQLKAQGRIALEDKANTGIDTDEIEFDWVHQEDGKTLELYDPRHVQVEYDENFHGGDYSDSGDDAYIPLAWIEFFGGDIEKAFEHCTGYLKENIIHYTEGTTEYFTKDGEPYEELCLIWDKEELAYSPAFFLYDLQGQKREAAVKYLADQFLFHFEDGINAHVNFIIKSVTEMVTAHKSFSCSVSNLLQLAFSLQEYLKQWQEDLARGSNGTNDEANKTAAEETLLLTLRYIYPDWVTIEKR